MDIEIQYFDDCPSWQVAHERVLAAAGQLGAQAAVRLTRVASDEEAVRIGFAGSPTIRVGGRDLFPSPMRAVGMSCRVYRTETGTDGAPSVQQLTAALSALEGSSPTG